MTDDDRMTEETEKARVASIKSYRNLVDHMFKNVLNDTNVVVRASEAFVETAKLCHDEEDMVVGTNMVNIIKVLHDATMAIKDKYIEQFEGAIISDEEWSKLDVTMEKEVDPKE